jgi:hypothetical protein
LECDRPACDAHGRATEDDAGMHTVEYLTPNWWCLIFFLRSCPHLLNIFYPFLGFINYKLIKCLFSLSFLIIIDFLTYNSLQY